MKTIRRNWLKKQIELGKVEAKCNRHLTDDYAFDNANDFGKTNWLPARISKPKFEEVTLQNGITIDRCSDHDFIDDYMNFHEEDFGSSAGGAYYKDDTQQEISFYIHSNAHYTLRIKEA